MTEANGEAETLIEVGDFWTIGAQEYQCVDTAPHVCRDGREIELAVVKTRCAVCGCPITTTMHRKANKRHSVRRCGVHKAIGVRVSKNEIFVDRRQVAAE